MYITCMCMCSGLQKSGNTNQRCGLRWHLRKRAPRSLGGVDRGVKTCGGFRKQIRRRKQTVLQDEATRQDVSENIPETGGPP